MTDIDTARATGGFVGPSHRTTSVLVVDDDPDQRFLISRRLNTAGMHVRTAASGEEALASLDGVDLVLLDYRLGGHDGLEVLMQIRSRPEPPAVVMVTGMGSEQVAIACMRAGASDYVVKEHRFLDPLPTVVERAWRHHDLERRARGLERLAQLVTSATDREIALAEIVAGAIRLLAADHCELLLAGRPDQAADAPGRAGAVRPAASAGDRPDGEVIEELRIPVAMPDTGPLGELVLQRAASAGAFTAEESGLAATFAGFAAVAISNLYQLELERELVAALERTLDLRRQLVASVSHELRTPLTAISGFAQTMLTHWDKLEDSDRLSMMRRILTNASDLGVLVEQLLDFASVEAGRLQVHLGAVDLKAVIDGAMADLGPLLVDRTVVVDVEDGLYAHADEVIIRRLLYNLITNAVKYTPNDAAIAVRAMRDPKAAGRVRVEVADTGDGLQPDEAARVFEAFWRADGTRHAQRGTGIGLALVRDYARLMGGESGVDSTPGEGATFWFTLRRAVD